MVIVMTTYYSLLEMNTDTHLWSIAFGDCDKEVVQDEMYDSYADVKTKIIRTNESQAAIDKKVSELNADIAKSVSSLESEANINEMLTNGDAVQAAINVANKPYDHNEITDNDMDYAMSISDENVIIDLEQRIQRVWRLADLARINNHVKAMHLYLDKFAGLSNELYHLQNKGSV